MRPADKNKVIMDLDKYLIKEKEDVEWVTNLRRRTTLLFNNNQDLIKELCIEDFDLLKILGKGAFGKVILAQKRDNWKYYAIKILNKDKIIQMDQVEHTIAEKMIL